MTNKDFIKDLFEDSDKLEAFKVFTLEIIDYIDDDSKLFETILDQFESSYMGTYRSSLEFAIEDLHNDYYSIEAYLNQLEDDGRPINGNFEDISEEDQNTLYNMHELYLFDEVGKHYLRSVSNGYAIFYNTEIY